MTDSIAAANKQLVRRVIEEIMNTGDLERADRYFGAEYVLHTPGLDNGPTGPEAFKQAIGMWLAAFPDWHMTVDALVGDGDLVANRFTTTGTHRGPLMGFPATGRPMTIHGMDMHRVVDNLVQESWVSDDVPAILMQLGVIRPPAMGAAPSGGPTPDHEKHG